jgi:mannose-6-phosphate isomerase-like protein (cupin superfamily)
MPSHPTVKLLPTATYQSLNQPPIAYTLQMISEDRPWGRYTILYTGPDCQVKRIEVAPGKRLSLQSHQFRAEHWFIVSGTGTAQVGDSTFAIKPGDTIDISILEKHRISADENGTLSFIEVQTGSSFDEQDIVRHQDDFGRSLF